MKVLLTKKLTPSMAAQFDESVELVNIPEGDAEAFKKEMAELRRLTELFPVGCKLVEVRGLQGQELLTREAHFFSSAEAVLSAFSAFSSISNISGGP